MITLYSVVERQRQPLILRGCARRPPPLLRTGATMLCLFPRSCRMISTSMACVLHHHHYQIDLLVGVVIAVAEVSRCASTTTDYPQRPTAGGAAEQQGHIRQCDLKLAGGLLRAVPALRPPRSPRPRRRLTT